MKGDDGGGLTEDRRKPRGRRTFLLPSLQRSRRLTRAQAPSLSRRWDNRRRDEATSAARGHQTTGRQRSFFSQSAATVTVTKGAKPEDALDAASDKSSNKPKKLLRADP